MLTNVIHATMICGQPDTRLIPVVRRRHHAVGQVRLVCTQPDKTAHRLPGTATHHQRDTTTHTQPGVMAHWRPGTAAHSQPGTTAYTQPGTTAHTQPGTAEHSQPHTTACGQADTAGHTHPGVRGAPAARRGVQTARHSGENAALRERAYADQHGGLPAAGHRGYARPRTTVCEQPDITGRKQLVMTAYTQLGASVHRQTGTNAHPQHGTATMQCPGRMLGSTGSETERACFEVAPVSVSLPGCRIRVKGERRWR